MCQCQFCVFMHVDAVKKYKQVLQTDKRQGVIQVHSLPENNVTVVCMADTC